MSESWRASVQDLDSPRRRDLETQVRRLLDYCELPFEQACIDYHESERAVRTASSEQVRQPIYDTAIDHWRNYEPHLAELVDALQPVLKSD